MSFYKKFFNPTPLFHKRHSVIQRIMDMPSDIFNFLRYYSHRIGLTRLQEYDRIDTLKNIHQGKKAFLIGNGPSVKIEELDRIYNTEFVTFCANRIHLAYSEMKFRPDYVVSADSQVIQDFGQEIVNSNNGNVCLVYKKKSNISGNFFSFHLSKRISLKFSTNIYKDVTLSGGTLFAAMQIAYHMGIRQFYLYGVDHDFKYEERNPSDGAGDASGDGNHFIKGYRSGKTWFAPRYELVEQGFKKADDFLRTEGGFVVNATHGGKLEVLKRISLVEVIGES